MSVVLVTGSSSGIGLATAVHFARLGHDVYAGVRSPSTVTELDQAIETEKLPIRRVAIDAKVARGVGGVRDGKAPDPAGRDRRKGGAGSGRGTSPYGTHRRPRQQRGDRRRRAPLAEASAMKQC